MAIRTTTELIEALQARLKSLPLTTDVGSVKLFERVGVFGANSLVAAMQATFATEQRVCFIVPGGDDYPNQRNRNTVFVQGNAKIALIIADRSMNQEDASATIGGKFNLGVLPLKDRIVANLLTEAFAGPDLAFVPSNGEPLVITDPEKPTGNLGREAYLLWVTAYAGMTVMVVP